MTIYVDGSAMSRALIDTPESLDWRAWIAEHADELVTTPLGLTELRRVADPLGSDARLAADMIGRRVTVLRFSDQALRVAAMAAGVLSPFAALHLGTADSHPD